MDYSEKVAQDPSLHLGTLPNGLTYYVKSNPKPVNTVELRLVVKVGSLVEVSKMGASVMPHALPI